MAKINSASTTNLLGQLQGNDKEMGRNLLKLATGQKLNNSGDDTSGFTISERMRVRLRALERAGENTQTGYNMIDTASRAVQEQLNLMRTIKEKVIDANNDSNTDADRLIIQKEITHAFQEIQDIAYETTYNGKRLLSGGDYVKASVFAWNKLDEAVKVEGSDSLNLIPDIYDVLDEQEGAFDVFSLWKTRTSSDGGKNGLTTAAPWEVTSQNLVNRSHAKATATFTGYGNAAALDGHGVQVTSFNDSNGSGQAFVFTTNTSDNYPTGVNKVNIAGISSVADAISRLAASINSVMSAYGTASASGNTLTVEAKADGANGDSTNISGYRFTGGGTTGVNRAAADNTGASFGRFSGGTDSSGIVGDHDAPYIPATPATARVTGLSSAASGTGFTMYVSGTSYIRLIDGTSGPSYNSSDRTYTVGKNASFSNYRMGNATVSMSGGTMTVTTPVGSSYNNSYFSDGIPSASTSTNSNKSITEANMSVSRTAGDFDNAGFTMDVSSYVGNTDQAALENFIQALAGITNNYFTLQNRSGYYYEFIDTGSKESVAAISKVANGITSKKIDLNNMRTAVASGGQDIATAFSNAVRNAVGNYNTYVGTELAYDTAGSVTGVTFTNGYQQDGSKILWDFDATLGHYTLDFSGVNTGNIAQLDDKGFRFYCATDELQWYNFLFDDGKEDLPDRPPSGTATMDINTATIDISAVTNTASLVSSIYEDGDAMMEEINHYYRLSKVAADSSKLYIYDPRRFNISTAAAYRGRYNERGAKIADGVMDNVIKDRRDIRQKQIIIQDTDKADFNTRLYIDQTTLDHLFEYKIGNDDIFNYSVASQADREKFLGNGETGEEGMLDKAIQKLLEAQTLLGSQAGRLEATRLNLTVTSENEQASESVIRDVDMAKATVEFAKSSILTRSSQAMLAQANNDTGSVLSLLQ